MKRILSIIVWLSAMTVSAQTFSVDTISDAVFQRMWGKSYKKNCTVARSELRYLRLSHYDGQGREHIGEMVCNKKIANDIKDIFQELYKHRYPIGRMQLIDDYDADDERSMQDNNTSCFNYRAVAGTNKLSKHSQGLAIDINPLYNPCVRRRKDGSVLIQPSTAHRYANRSKKLPCTIDKEDLCYQLFIKHGFTWGGSWRTVKDYQHFER
ncbi:MAG: M15 family metallopeptidase [Prevotella sp.]|nr:M15 family metallopeptidase [Prevotella sp.]